MNLNFEDIRPYNDSEYKKAIEELFDVEQLIGEITGNFPEMSIDEIKELLLSFNGIQEFQSNVICRIIQNMIDTKMANFSYDGLTDLDKKKSYIYITNHRDIVVDSALINYSLNDKNYNTCEIAIGSNLLSKPWIKRLVRLNKTFIVKRNIPLQEMLEASRILSSYIDYTLKEKKQSLWIAQREGRAKDGFDKTNPGLLKMFGMAGEGDLLEHLISLNITPVSISYELDPCDSLKIAELLCKEEGKEYIKKEGEDAMQMALGIKGWKGNAHLQFGKPINDDIKKLSHIKNRNELLKNVALVIDSKIYKDYHLWNSNYVAYDLLNSTKKYVDKYDENGEERFIDYMNEKLTNFKGNEQAKRIFLLMYANPVINAEGTK
jgi:1-acyl-sn-glycerol-3-phosphate acyltransferase